MTSTNTALTEAWTQIDTGPKTGINVQPRTERCEIFVETSEPSATTNGIIINPDDFRNVDLESGENLYAKAHRGTTVITVTD